MTGRFPLKEAAAIGDIRERDIRKAVEAKVICPSIVFAGRAPRYLFTAHDLLYLKLIASFPFALRREDKRALQDIVEMKRQSSGRWYQGDHDIVVESGGVVFRVDVKPALSRIAHRLLVFRRGRHRIVSNPAILGGEPVFEGTRIPLSHIANLLSKNVPVHEIREDYPSLGPEELEFAALVALMKPDPSRPLKPLHLRRGSGPTTTNHRDMDRREAPAGGWSLA